jgi:hypothetical protein
MSIYATLWELQFPSRGDAHAGCSWVTVLAQGVPEHVGSDGPDIFASFLPPLEGSIGLGVRAVVFVPKASAKDTGRSPQEYVSPLLVLSGREYAAIPFSILHQRITDALRGEHPRVLGEVRSPDGKVRVMFEDGTDRDVAASG